MHNELQYIDSGLFGPLKEKASASPRLRANYNFHSGSEENPQRFLNVLAHGTFVPPHRHLHPPKAETFLVLDGKVGLFLFDDTGKVTLAEVIGGSHRMGVDIQAGVWHTLVALTPHVVLFEVKAGPYLGNTEMDFPAWAPQEGDPAAGPYQEGLLNHLKPAIDPHK
jgi:cupin fold WbuC family metalloprotein